MTSHPLVDGFMVSKTKLLTNRRGAGYIETRCHFPPFFQIMQLGLGLLLGLSKAFTLTMKRNDFLSSPTYICEMLSFRTRSILTYIIYLITKHILNTFKVEISYPSSLLIAQDCIQTLFLRPEFQKMAKGDDNHLDFPEARRVPPQGQHIGGREFPLKNSSLSYSQ